MVLAGAKAGSAREICQGELGGGASPPGEPAGGEPIAPPPAPAGGGPPISLPPELPSGGVAAAPDDAPAPALLAVQISLPRRPDSHVPLTSAPLLVYVHASPADLSLHALIRARFEERACAGGANAAQAINTASDVKNTILRFTRFAPRWVRMLSEPAPQFKSCGASKRPQAESGGMRSALGRSTRADKMSISKPRDVRNDLARH